ncbi:MAG: ATP-binding cassette domain-containing protein [Thaumarchaeota archaeon]|nr:ATP-binding cassette domain-containing protein [Nitrososphaerota archaeon]
MASKGPEVPLLSVEGLSFSYLDSPRAALTDVNLKINRGEIVILAGQSGCGKSTLLRCVNGLIPHMYPGDYKGRIVVDGDVVAETPMGKLAQMVGFLFQNPENQIFMFSVERDIAFGLENQGLPRQEMRRRVDEVMGLLHIEPLALRPPHELSDGQKQRVALAGIIAMRPNLVILDEPTSLLDPKTASELVSLVSKLNKELGITFVIVEHRLELLTPIADRIVVMDKGRVVMEGTPTEVLTNPASSTHGLAIPPVFSLYSELAERGSRLPRAPLTPEEMAQELNAP